MRFTRLLARAARTEYRTPPMKDHYDPGRSFGIMSRGAPAYLTAGLIMFFGCVENAYWAHHIMESGVARTSIERRIELEREPDLTTIDLRGITTRPHHYPNKSPFYSRLEFMVRHPGLIFDHTMMIIYEMFWIIPNRL